MFRAFVDENSLFIPTRSPRPVGTRQGFLIQLKDGQPMLRGQGEVIESYPEVPAPAKRVGMRLRIVSLDVPSQELHMRLLQHKRTQTVPPPFRGGVTPTVRFLVPPMPAPAPAEGQPAEPRVESRVPGASYTLPANPFSELPPEALEHFIDCTIYEDTGTPPAAPPHWVVAASTSVSSSSSGTPEPVPVDGTERVSVLPPVPAPPTRRSAVVVAAVSIGAAGLGLIGGYLLWARPPEPPPRPASATTATAITPTKPPAAPAPTPAAAPVASVAPASTPAPPPSPEPKPAEPKPAEPKPAEPEPATVVTPLPVAAPAEPPPPSPNDCVGSFDTDPSGADVTVNGLNIGRTPISGAVVPCGPIAIGLSHPRYERFDKKLSAAAGAPFTIQQRLVRPEATLEIASSPSGATILVHGENIGRAPTRVKLDSYTTYKITATLEGHKVWSQSVYVRGKAMTVTARMEAMDGAARPRWRPGPTARK